MATLYKRIKHLTSTKKIRPVLQKERLAFGRDVFWAFMRTDGHPYIGWCESLEPEGKFIVRAYPKSLVPEIDKMIIGRFKQKRIRINQPVNGKTN